MIQNCFPHPHQMIPAVYIQWLISIEQRPQNFNKELNINKHTAINNGFELMDNIQNAEALGCIYSGIKTTNNSHKNVT